MIVILLALVGLAADPAPAAGPVAVEGASPHPAVVSHDHSVVGPVDDVSGAMADLLAGRADVRCADLLTLGEPDQVRDALVEGTQVSLPPWAPMRAASCLTQLAATDDLALVEVEKLVSLQDQPGFALAVAERLGGLPEPRALRLAQAALANPAPALASRLPARLRACPHAPVQALTR